MCVWLYLKKTQKILNITRAYGQMTETLWSQEVVINKMSPNTGDTVRWSVSSTAVVSLLQVDTSLSSLNQYQCLSIHDD